MHQQIFELGDQKLSSSLTTIESSGTTSLLTDGTHYYLQVGTGPMVELSYGGAPVVAGQFGGWTPIAAQQTATGYEVAWKVTGADQYGVWYTDASGNYLSSPIGTVSGTSAALESFEVSFNHDLNGDGIIGPPPPGPPPPPPPTTVIESSGTTSLLTDGTHYYLQVGTGPMIELSYGGAPVVAGANGGWTPIAAQQISAGFEVAWKLAGSNQYAVWDTDSSGNYVSTPINDVSGTSAALESIETSFNHDLNGDGIIGPPPPPPPTLIEANGSMSLLSDGTNYLLNPNGGTTVKLSYNGSPVTVGQFGGWTPIAAARTANGYQVAWKVTGADQYGIWYTDASGNYLSAPSGTVSGTSATLESYETSFNYDLNGDGTIGLTLPPPPPPPPPPSPPPQFVYQGTDANGAKVYDITWSSSGLQPFAVRVLAPSHPSTSYPHTFLYDLPVEAGLAQSTYGSGLNQLENLDVEDQYNATIIEPIFPIDSWYANSGTDPTINYDTFMSTILPQWVDSTFDPSGIDKNLLIGFSKSGYGGLDLLFKHPSVFDAAAAFDFPADMPSYNQMGPDPAADYGTDANFQYNYRLSENFFNILKAPFTTQNRVWISEGPLYGSQVADFDALLSAEGVMHTLSTTETTDAHSWSGGWLSNAVAGLYGLEKKLHSGATS
jgi:cytochrome c2